MHCDLCTRFRSDQPAFLRKVAESVQASVEDRYKAPPADCPIVFKERLPGVYFLRDALLGTEEAFENDVYG